MFNYVQKFLIVLFLCIIPIAAMERERAALGVSILAYLCREKANAELLNVIEAYVIPHEQKKEEVWNKILKNDFTPQMLSPEELIYIPGRYKIIIKKYWKKIEKCLKKGADSNLKSKIPLLCLAVKDQKKEIFNLLLHQRADINNSADISIHPIKRGYTPLHLI